MPKNKIPLVDLVSQDKPIQSKINAKLEEVIRAGRYISGPQVDQLEGALEKYLHIDYAITCASGTDALLLALMALDITQGDEIIIPAYTYAAIAEVACLLGINIRVVDVDLDTFLIIPEELNKLINKQTRAIVTVGLFGQCANLEEIYKIAQQHNIKVINDHAQCLGAQLVQGDQKKSPMEYGDIFITSFFPTKNLGCYGDGGALFTAHPETAKKLKMLTRHGQSKKYVHDIIGLNSRLDTIQAAILMVKLQDLDNLISSRSEIAEWYNTRLNDDKSVSMPVKAAHSTHSYHQYVIKVRDRRDNLQSFLASHHISTGIYYPMPIHHQKAYKSFIAGKNKCRNSERLSSNTLALPIYRGLKEDDVDYICSRIKTFYND